MTPRQVYHNLLQALIDNKNWSKERLGSIFVELAYDSLLANTRQEANFLSYLQDLEPLYLSKGIQKDIQLDPKFANKVIYLTEIFGPLDSQNFTRQK